LWKEYSDARAIGSNYNRNNKTNSLKIHPLCPVQNGFPSIVRARTEADIELAVIDFKSSGEPIQFDRETREVIYTTPKEE
jgi:hypothetical protein